MVDFTKEERAIIDDSITYYRTSTFPDYKLDKNDPDTILNAMEHAHTKGQVISPTNIRAHAIWRAVQRKLGVEVEEPEERQKRLAKERYEKRHGILLEAKKKEAAEAHEIANAKDDEVKKVEVELETLKAEDAGVARAVAEAQKEKLEAEQKAQAALEEINRLNAELKKANQRAKELDNSKGAIEELAKNEKADVQKVVSVPEIDEKSLEEKSIEELVEELTKPE